jgi:hypothetical protein
LDIVLHILLHYNNDAPQTNFDETFDGIDSSSLLSTNGVNERKHQEEGEKAPFGGSR